MSYFLAILFIVTAAVLFFLYFIIKKYSLKKTLYYISSIFVTIMILLFLSKIYDFIFRNIFSTVLLIIPFALITIYLEKFFIKEVKTITVMQPIFTQHTKSEKCEISQQTESLVNTNLEQETETILEIQSDIIPQNRNEKKLELDKNSLQVEIRELLTLCERIDDLNINGSHFDPPASEEEILNWERTNGITIPESFKEWLRFSNDAEIIGFTARILGVKSMVASPREFTNESPEDLVIIGHMGGCGDVLCFSKTTGKIIWLYDYRERDEFDSFKDIILELIRQGKGILG